MIKVNELRVGNWLKESILEIPFKLSKVDKEIEEQGFLPIPLTPEILEKAGFVERDRALLESYGYRNFIHRNATIQIGPNGIKTWVSNKMDEPVEHIKYLHELQNLYFALTGEELNIEL